MRGSGFNGDLASDFSNVQAVPRVRLQCKVAPGSGRERAGKMGEQGAAHAAREKTFESANQATKLVTNLPCSQERPPAGRAGGQQGAHQRQPPSAPPRCGWWAPWGRATIAAKDRRQNLESQKSKVKSGCVSGVQAAGNRQHLYEYLWLQSLKC